MRSVPTTRPSPVARGRFFLQPLCVALLLTGIACGEDSYYAVPLTDLKLSEGELPKETYRSDSGFPASQWSSSFAVLDGEGEIYLDVGAISNPGGVVVRDFSLRGTEYQLRTTDSTGKAINLDIPAVAIRVPHQKDVSGQLYFARNSAKDEVHRVKFTLPAGKAKAESHGGFLAAKIFYCEKHSGESMPGAAWFRAQALEARRILEKRGRVDDVLAAPAPERRERESNTEHEFEVFSGGRAISENLQLDRLLRPTKPGDADQPIAEIEGISVREMDWKPLIKDIEPKLDPLASVIPSDQHAVFFPTFTSLVRVLDETEKAGLPVARMLEQDPTVRERYEKQICLELDGIARAAGDKFIASVAFTGGDPYLLTGTDVAVLMEAKSVETVTTAITARHVLAANTFAGCEQVKGTVAGVSYTGVVTPSRSICSYMATLDRTVVVTNSLVQLERLANAANGSEPNLASLAEYKFFRHRYPRDNGDESGFLMISDATLRRWCGPKWRIASARRVRAAGIQMHHQAAHLDELATGKARPQKLETNLYVPDLGTLELTNEGVTSSTYGTLAFLTPISELDLSKVTSDERIAYERWRNGYQRNWRQFFDPIGLSFSLKDATASADLTVMPLIASSEYQQFINVVGKSKLTPTSADLHEGTLFHWAMAFDPKSQAVEQAGNAAQAFVAGVTGGPFSWVGHSIAFYADMDPFWQDLAKAENTDDFFKNEFHRLPIALRVDVADSVKLVAFLAIVRKTIEGSAPELTNWEILKHNERSYVKVSPRNPEMLGGGGIPNKIALYYAATPKSLVVSLNEDVMKRAMDRESQANAPGAKPDAAPKGDAPPAKGKPWLGSSLGLQVDRNGFDPMTKLADQSAQQHLQSQSWRAIPILNEWKRLFPNQDPVALHARFWQMTLECPGGGRYVWNEKDRTMESTKLGHPGRPKTDATVPDLFHSIGGANFGLTFENQGLRARVEVERKP